MARFIQKLTRDEAVNAAMTMCPTDPNDARVRQFVEFGFRLLEMLDVVQFRDSSMPWCDRCQCYHRLRAPHVGDMNDRQIANVVHGRDADDNGEFTASSIGEAQDRLRNDIARGRRMIEVWPVIHVRDREQALECAELAFHCNCAGAMIISMSGGDEGLDPIGAAIRETFPNLKLGVNYLTERPGDALVRSLNRGYAATWTDCQMFTRGETSPEAVYCDRLLQRLENNAAPHKFFVAVAFKGQAPDPFPGDSANVAAFAGFIPTTSGPATGFAPDIEKVASIRRRLDRKDPLAIASGVTPENIGAFASHITHALVATGISKDFHHFDEAKLRALMEKTR